MEYMEALEKKHYFTFSATLIIFAAIDFATKHWAVTESADQVSIIPGLLYTINFHKNEGIAFGIGLPLWLQVLGSVIILFFVLLIGFDHILQQKKFVFFQAVFLGSVVGGGLGNLVDRIVSGYVIDFIVLRPLPVFNVADIGITVGLILLFGTIVLTSGKPKK